MTASSRCPVFVHYIEHPRGANERYACKLEYGHRGNCQFGLGRTEFEVEGVEEREWHLRLIIEKVEAKLMRARYGEALAYIRKHYRDEFKSVEGAQPGTAESGAVLLGESHKDRPSTSAVCKHGRTPKIDGCTACYFEQYPPVDDDGNPIILPPEEPDEACQHVWGEKSGQCVKCKAIVKQPGDDGQGEES